MQRQYADLRKRRRAASCAAGSRAPPKNPIRSTRSAPRCTWLCRCSGVRAAFS